MNIHLVGVPSDLGASCHGADLGSNAIRYADLGNHQLAKKLRDQGNTLMNKLLRELGHTVIDEGNLAVPASELPASNPKLKNLEPIQDLCDRLAVETERICTAGGFPLVLGGDHSISLGSVTGVARARGPIGVIWIDAHGDFNTDQITPSGNIHGMPLAALAGYGHERMVNLHGFSPKVAPAHIAIVGARDLDPDERKLLHEAKVHVFTMKDIDRQGFNATMAQALEITTSGTNGLHVSFDMDAVDPQEAPGVGTRVAGGLTRREARLAMELIADSGKLTSLDMAEVNPTLDQQNRTANLAVELILVALGKRLF